MDTIQDIVGKQAYDEIDKLKLELSELYSHFSKIAGDMKTIEITLQGNLDLKQLSGTLADLITKYKQYDKVVMDIAIKEEKRKKIIAETELIEQRKANLQQQRASREKKDLDDIASKEEKIRKDREKADKSNADKERKRLIDINNAGRKEELEIQRELSRIEKERRDREKAELGGNRLGANVSVYQNTRKELNALQDQLRSYEIQLNRAARSGRYTDEQLKSMRDNVQLTRKAWEDLNQELTEVENASGGSSRSRNQLLVETNQLLREMPNFAISARTGILAISNNLPMFIAAWSRISQEIDSTTNRARGFRGAMQQLGKALVSFETIVIVALTVLIQYQEEISDWITNVSDAEKAQRDYNNALQESMKSVSSDISLLLQLKSVMNDGNSTIEQRNRLLTQAQEKYVGYFDSINASTTALGDFNIQVERQIDLLTRQAQQEAVSAAIKKSVEELTVAQMDLNKEFGFWETAWSNIRSRFRSNPYNELTDDAKEYYNTQKEILKNVTGTLNISYLGVIEQRAINLSNAQKEFNASLDLGGDLLDNEGKRIDNSIKLLSDRKKEIEATIKRSQEYYGFVDKGAKEEIRLLDEQINKWSQKRDEIKKASDDTRAYYTNMRTMSDIDMDLTMARTELYKQERNTTGFVAANNRLIRTEYAKTLLDIQSKFGGWNDALNENQEYNILVAEATAKMNRELADNKIKVTKTTKSYWDWQRAIEKVYSDMERLNFEISKAKVENENVGLQQIIEDESKSLEERLEANRQFYLNRERLAAREADRENAIIENGLIRKLELESKIGFSIQSEADLRRLERDKRLTNEQKDFLASTLLYGQQRIQIENSLNAQLSEISKNASDNSIDIIKSDYDNRVRAYSDGMQDVANAITSATNRQISDLAKERNKGLISETEYFNKRDAIIRKEGSKVLESQVQFSENLLKEYRDYIASDDFNALPELTKQMFIEVANNVEKGIGDVRRKMQSDTSQFGSIGDNISKMLGIIDKKAVDSMIKSVIDTFSEMFSTLNSLWDNYYENRKLALDKDEQRSQEAYETEKYRIESSLQSEKDKDIELQALESGRLASEKLFAKERKRIEIEQAKRQQAMALMEVTIKTAAGIADVWSKHAANPVVAGVLTGALVAQMALQIAKIQSTPIPAYEFGTPESGHPGGIALVGEKRRELAITPGGGLFYTPSTPTLMNLPMGTHVIPNPDAMGQLAKLEAIERLSGIQVFNTNEMDVSGIRSDLGKLQQTIIDKKENHFFIKNGEFRIVTKTGNNKTKYIKIL